MITLQEIKDKAEQAQKESDACILKINIDNLDTAFRRIFHCVPSDEEIKVGGNIRPYCLIEDIRVCAIEVDGIWKLLLFRDIGDSIGKESAVCNSIEDVNNFINKTNILINEYKNAVNSNFWKNIGVILGFRNNRT